jgi:hypothetical protein
VVELHPSKHEAANSNPALPKYINKIIKYSNTGQEREGKITNVRN